MILPNQNQLQNHQQTPSAMSANTNSHQQKPIAPKPNSSCEQAVSTTTRTTAGSRKQLAFQHPTFGYAIPAPLPAKVARRNARERNRVKQVQSLTNTAFFYSGFSKKPQRRIKQSIIREPDREKIMALPVGQINYSLFGKHFFLLFLQVTLSS